MFVKFYKFRSGRPALHPRLELLQRLFLNPGYIGPADAALSRNLPLGAGRPVVQAVAHGNDHPFSRSQAGLDALAYLYAGIPGIQVLQHVVVHGNHVHQGQRPPVPRRLQGIGQRHLALELALRPEIHQYLVCYTIIAARNPVRVGKQTSSDEKWCVFGSTSSNMIVMSRYANETVVYAPFYIHSFQLVQPHTVVEAEKFNIRYSDPSQIDNTPDKLRWYRYRCGLLQRDVADFAGIDRSTYSSYEEIGRDYYPIENIEKISKLFSVPVTELLDEYNLFLYNDQGKQIKRMREARNMTQREFARRLGVSYGTLQQWEQNRVQMFKKAWINLMERG